MSSQRFDKLCEHFHIPHHAAEIPRGTAGYDQLAKVQPVMTVLAETFPKYMHDSRNQTIDEGMVKFKGRCSFLQYMKAKPTKWGIKTFFALQQQCISPRIHSVLGEKNAIGI